MHPLWYYSSLWSTRMTNNIKKQILDQDKSTLCSGFLFIRLYYHLKLHMNIFSKVYLHMKVIAAWSWDYPKVSFQLQFPIILLQSRNKVRCNMFPRSSKYRYLKFEICLKMMRERVVESIGWTYFSWKGSLRRTSGAIHWGYKEK